MTTTSHKTSLHPQQGYSTFETRQQKDPTLSLLKETVFEGWPQIREKCPPLLRDYWNFREELTVKDGLLPKGDRILIPSTLNPKVLGVSLMVAGRGPRVLSRVSRVLKKVAGFKKSRGF